LFSIFLFVIVIDWRSLSQVKELGVMFYDCERIAWEVKKVFEMYWMSATIKQLPVQWPSMY
jgi:phospholipase D3/4